MLQCTQLSLVVSPVSFLDYITGLS